MLPSTLPLGLSLFTLPAMAEDLEPALAPRAPAATATTPVVLGTAYGGALDPLTTLPPEHDSTRKGWVAHRASSHLDKEYGPHSATLPSPITSEP